SYVEALGIIGTSHEDICHALRLRKLTDISPSTLRKHYRLELDLGSTMATASVAASLYRAALKAATDSKYIAAAIFWMKTKGGWRERDRMDDLIEAAKKDLENAPISDKEKAEIAAGIDTFLSDLETKGRSRR
ncbi:MAG: hypothetical protein IID41_17305, partial [Planctomycetes bacterium]|nr:hypothetical protein [Planctomycetota bacterium]